MEKSKDREGGVMTTRKTLVRKKMRSGDSIPVDAEVVHTEAKGGTGPLIVWYFEPEDYL